MLLLLFFFFEQDYVIHQWHDESPEFHNLLALQYKDKVMSLMEEYMQNLPEGTLLVQCIIREGFSVRY